MGLDLTKFNYALKNYYDSKKMFDVVSKDHPWLSMLMNRVTLSGGKAHSFPLVYGRGKSSASFTDAQSNSEGQVGKEFLLTHNNDYSVIRIDGEVLELSSNDDMAFFKARTAEFDAQLKVLADSLSHALFRSGSGSIGRVKSTQTDVTTIELATISDIKNFEVGMAIVADSTDGTGTVGTTVSYVKSVNRVAGTFTVAATRGGAAISAATADLAANQYIFPQGSFGSKLKGMQAWIPASVSGGESFFGVDRSVDKERLAGWYIDKTGSDPEDAIVDAAQQLADFSNAKPDMAIVSFSTFNTISKNSQGKVQYIEVKPGADASIYFQGIVINGPKGPIKVIGDADCPSNEIYVIQSDTWELVSFGSKDPIHMAHYGAPETLLQSAGDGIEGRFVYRCQLACKAPGLNSRVKIS